MKPSLLIQRFKHFWQGNGSHKNMQIDSGKESCWGSQANPHGSEKSFKRVWPQLFCKSDLLGDEKEVS